MHNKLTISRYYILQIKIITFNLLDMPNKTKLSYNLISTSCCSDKHFIQHVLYNIYNKENAL